MAKGMKTTCKKCQYCRQGGRQQSQRGTLGRRKYYCEHPSVGDIKDKYGWPIDPFIGFGDMSRESPLVLKTRKKWCPMEVTNG